MWVVPVLAKGVLHVGGACLSQGCVACGGGPLLPNGVLHVPGGLS